MRILTSPGTAAKAACHLVLRLSILLGAAAIYGSIPGTTISVLPVSPANPTSLAVGGDGNIWYREADTGQATSFVIGRFDPKGASPARFTIPAPGGCKISLGAIATGPDGNIWIAYVEQATSCTGFNSVGGLIRIMPDGTSAAFPVANVINAADALIAGPDGNLWFTDGPNSYVYRLTTAGAGTRFDVSSASPLGLSAGIAIASDGNL